MDDLTAAEHLPYPDDDDSDVAGIYALLEQLFRQALTDQHSAERDVRDDVRRWVDRGGPAYWDRMLGMGGETRAATSIGTETNAKLWSRRDHYRNSSFRAGTQPSEA